LVTLKKQTGIWVNSQVWQAYRELCSREKLRSAEPMLLSALKDVADPNIREAIEEEISIKTPEEKRSRKEVKTEEEITEELAKLKKEIKA